MSNVYLDSLWTLWSVRRQKVGAVPLSSYLAANTTLPTLLFVLQNVASLRGPSQVGVSSGCLCLASPGCGLWLYESEKALGGGWWHQIICNSIPRSWELLVALEGGNNRVCEA